jgi:sugar (pentulose or hexulose) kinase
VLALSIRAGDATSLGAAMAAGVGVGVFRDLGDAARRVRVEGTVAPNEGVREVYERGFAVYGSLYPALRGAFAEARRDSANSGFVAEAGEKPR